MPRESFPKTCRLRKRGEFLAVQRDGRKVQGQYFLLLTRGGEGKRIGITVSSKVGSAVVRNRIKRWVREYARRHKDALASGDTVVIARAAAAGAEAHAVWRDLEGLFRRARGGGA